MEAGQKVIPRHGRIARHYAGQKERPAPEVRFRETGHPFNLPVDEASYENEF